MLGYIWNRHCMAPCKLELPLHCTHCTQARSELWPSCLSGELLECHECVKVNERIYSDSESRHSILSSFIDTITASMQLLLICMPFSFIICCYCQHSSTSDVCQPSIICIDSIHHWRNVLTCIYSDVTALQFAPGGQMTDKSTLQGVVVNADEKTKSDRQTSYHIMSCVTGW